MKILNFEWMVPKIIGMIVFLVCFIVLAVMAVEFHNISKYSLELADMTREVMEDSCRFFAQESFRGSSISKGNTYVIKGYNGTELISGKFYEDTEEETYNKLYINNSNAEEYIKWLNTMIGGESDVQKNDTYLLLYDILTNKERSEFKSFYVTPNNLGFTYLDPDVLKHIFAWKFINRLSATGIKTGKNSSDFSVRNTIVKDEKTNQWFVRWHGFRIYIGDGSDKRSPSAFSVDVDPDQRCSLLKLSSDLSNPDNDTFSDYSNIYAIDYINNSAIDSTDLRRFKIMYDIRWNIKIGYEGVLPLSLVSHFFSGDNYSTFILNDTEIFSFINPINNDDDGKDIHSIFRKTDRYNEETWNGDFGNSDITYFGNNDADYYEFSDIRGSIYNKGREIRDKGDLNKEKTVGLSQRLNFILVH